MLDQHAPSPFPLIAGMWRCMDDCRRIIRKRPPCGDRLTRGPYAAPRFGSRARGRTRQHETGSLAPDLPAETMSRAGSAVWLRTEAAM